MTVFEVIGVNCYDIYYDLENELYSQSLSVSIPLWRGATLDVDFGPFPQKILFGF